MSAGSGEALRLLVALPAAPDASALFALRALVDAGHVVRTRVAEAVPTRAGGIAGRLERREAARQRRVLAALFDARALEPWWQDRAAETAGAAVADVVDLAVSLVGIAPAAEDAPRARLGALALESADAALRGVVWGIVRERPEWIGVALHALGRDGRPRLVGWGAPQLAAGESGAYLLFRAYVDAVVHLVEAAALLASGTSLPTAAGGDPEGRPAGGPGLRAWLDYFGCERGARAALLCERAVVP